MNSFDFLRIPTNQAVLRMPKNHELNVDQARLAELASQLRQTAMSPPSHTLPSAPGIIRSIHWNFEEIIRIRRTS